MEGAQVQGQSSARENVGWHADCLDDSVDPHLRNGKLPFSITPSTHLRRHMGHRRSSATYWNHCSKSMAFRRCFPGTITFTNVSCPKKVTCTSQKDHRGNFDEETFAVQHLPQKHSTAIVPSSSSKSLGTTSSFRRLLGPVERWTQGR